MRAAYVYYRVNPALADEAAGRVAALMQALQSHCSALPRVLHRCDDTNTWMEVYEGIADWTAFVSALQHSTAELDIAACLAGERHIECFLPQGTHP